jgi:hypothetical protein
MLDVGIVCLSPRLEMLAGLCISGVSRSAQFVSFVSPRAENAREVCVFGAAGDTDDTNSPARQHPSDTDRSYAALIKRGRP